MSKLLVLDVFGVLCAKLPVDVPCSLPIIHATKYYRVVERPLVRAVLAVLFELYDVAVISSSTPYNVTIALKSLLSPQQLSALRFVWTRDRTHTDADTQYDTVKLLSDILEDPVINAAGQYSVCNTLICDDTAAKMRLNPPANVLICAEFTGSQDDTGLVTLLREIGERFGAL